MVTPKKPDILRVVVFIDGQNFYNDCKDLFGRGETNPDLLGQELCSPVFGPNRILQQVRFYTGIHDPRRESIMNSYMSRRLQTMRNNGVVTIQRPLKYSEVVVEDNNDPGSYIKIWRGREKGIDVRIALDMLMMALDNKYDVASLVSTDTDLEEAIRDIYAIRERLDRWIALENVVCKPPAGYPVKRLRSAKRIIKIDQDIYDRIRDDFNYWPR